MNVNTMIELLPLGLYNDPATRRVLVAMLEPMAAVDDYFAARAAKISTLLDPALVPDELVPYLAGIVGVGLDLEASNSATVSELRKLIPVAVALWKVKGTRPSWRALAAALAGSRAVILDWFYLRTVSGSSARVAVIPGPGGAGAPYTYPEHVTDLWIMDPAGTVNLDLLARFLDVARAANERINLYPAWLVDDLGVGGALWESAATGLGSWSYDSSAWELTSSDGYGFSLDLGGLPATWSDYHATFRLAVTGSARLSILRAGGDEYRVAIDQASGVIQLYRVIATVPTLLATFTGPPLAAGYPYMWALEAWEATGSTTVRLYREGAKLIDYVDSAGGRPSAGGLGWRSVGPSDVVTLSTALAWPAGLTPTRIGLNP